MTKIEKLLVWGSTVAVTVTGVVYAGMKYLMVPSEPWAVINHPLQPLMLKLHIVTAPFLIFGIGMIAMRHIWPHFKAGLKRGRRSGISSALLTFPMIATGYAIQALTSTSWLRVIGYIHLALGIVFAIGAVFHYSATRRRVLRGEIATRDTYGETADEDVADLRTEPERHAAFSRKRF